MLLLQKFESPLAGIIGGHLLLLGAEHRAAGPGLEVLNDVVVNLRTLVGTEHPDVEALSLACPDMTLRRTTPVTTPPMFERSWRMLVDGCRDDPQLVPLSLWQQVHTRLGGQSPYLTWALDDAAQSKFRTQLAETVFALSDGAQAGSAGAVQPVQAARSLMPNRRFAAAYVLRGAASTPPIADTAEQCAALLGVPPSALPVLRREYQSLHERKTA
jgi:hypothetical protein